MPRLTSPAVLTDLLFVIRRILAPALVAAMIVLTPAGFAQCNLDQEQTEFNSSTGGDRWQSFTPGIAGSLCRVEINCQDAQTGVLMEVYAGEGIGGPRLHSQTVNLESGVTAIDLTRGVTMLPGVTFTLRFVSIIGWRIKIPATYSGGRSSVGPADDYWFRTYVHPSCEVDQQQTESNSSAGGDRWQSFVGGLSGYLCQVEVQCVGGDDSGTMEIFAGEGLDGPLIYTQPVSLQAGTTTIALDCAVVLREGSPYTLRFTSISGWRIQIPASYPHGRSSVGANDDFWFRTLVVPQCQIDQQQTASNTSAGGDRWQSFTAGITGALCGIDVRCQSERADTTLEIYQGEGVNGDPLFTQAVDLQAGTTNIQLSPGVPMVGGATYTIRLTDCRAWEYQASNNYPGGRSSVSEDSDFWFRTVMMELAASCTTINGNDINPSEFLCLSPPALGSVWMSDIATTDSTLFTAIAISAQPAVIPFGDGELLFDVASPFHLLFGHGSIALALPNDCSFVGTRFIAQGLRVDNIMGRTELILLNGQALEIGF